jgi:hypothetical protein
MEFVMSAKANLVQITETLHNTLSGNELAVAEEVVSKMILKNGSVRKSKPKGESSADHLAKYVWRMVAFVCIPGPTSCMPVTAEFDLYKYIEEKNPQLKGVETIRYARIKNCPEKVLVKKIEDAVCYAIPKNQWVNIRSWGRALGSL